MTTEDSYFTIGAREDRMRDLSAKQDIGAQLKRLADAQAETARQLAIANQLAAAALLERRAGVQELHDMLDGERVF